LKITEIETIYTKSLTKIAEFESSSLPAFSFISGKLLAAVEKAFIQYDFLVSHGGEIAKNSALAIEETSYDEIGEMLPFNFSTYH